MCSKTMKRLCSYTRLKYFRDTQHHYSKQRNEHNLQIDEKLGKNSDIIGPPDPISNLRPIIFKKLVGETKIEKEYRETRETAQNWNQKFWSEHNANFSMERKKFQKELEAKGNQSVTADEMSVFYKSFLDKNWKNHLNYNISWCDIIKIIIRLLKAMENDNSSEEIVLPTAVYTLMEAVQTESTSSSSTNQSSSATNTSNVHILPLNNPTSTVTNTSIQPKISINKNTKPICIDTETSGLRKLLTMLLEINWSNYIRWKLLLSFGFILWIALCVTNKFYSRVPSVQRIEKIVHVPIEKIIYTKLPCEIDDDREENWFYKIRSYHSWTITRTRANEVFIYILIIGVMVCAETQLRKRINHPRECFSQCHNDFLGTQPIDYKHDEFTVKMMNNTAENLYDELSRFQRNNPHAVKMIPFDKLQLRRKINNNSNEVENIIKRTSNRHLNKLGIKSQTSGINRYEWNDNYMLDSPSLHMCNYNKSSPFSYKTPFTSLSKLHTYDTQINHFIKSNKNTSTTAFDEIIGDLQRFNNNFVKRRTLKDPNELFTNEIKNNRIISSSPAFKQFLIKLKNNPDSFNKFGN